MWKEISGETPYEYSLDEKGLIGNIEENRCVSRVIWMRYDENSILTTLQFFQCRCIVYERYDNFPIFSCVPRLYKGKITMMDSFLIHRVPTYSKEEVLFPGHGHRTRDRDFCFHVLFCEEGSTTCDSTEKGDTTEWDRYIAERRDETEFISFISVDPSFLYQSRKENGDGTRRCIG